MSTTCGNTVNDFLSKTRRFVRRSSSVYASVDEAAEFVSKNVVGMVSQ